MNVFYRAINIFIVFAFLVGCSSVKATENPTAISSPFSQPTPTTDYSKNLSTATVLLISTSGPSTTPVITETATTQNDIPTQDVEQPLVVQHPSACERTNVSRKYSPNGLWMVEFCDRDKNPVMAISNLETKVTWKLFYIDYLPDPGILPDGGLSVIQWSNDGRYLYFNSYVSGSGGECFVGVKYDQDGKGLFRFDLQTGDTTTILPLRGPFGGGYGFSFSQTGRRLVYETYSLGLKILDLQTGKLIDVDALSEESAGGDYVWSPDGLQFVYSVVSTIDNWETRIYSLRLVNALSGNQQILFESSDICFATNTWSDSDVLTLENYDQNYNRTRVEFDLKTKTVISETTLP